MANKLWVDRYRPCSLEQLDFHEDLTRLLHKLSTAADLPHLLFYGPSGAGKKTRVLALLSGLFGSGVYKTRCEARSFKVNSSNVDISVTSSNYHIDLTPADVSYRDKVVVQKIIKEIGGNRNPDQRAFKVVILNQADQLSQEAQAALRRTMEKCMATTRIILVCNSLCRVIAPLRSRCLCVRVPAPAEVDVRTVLSKIAGVENVHVPEGLLDRLVESSNRNLRRAVMMLQSCCLQYPSLRGDVQVPVPEWEKTLREVASGVLEEQTPKRLKAARLKLYDVLCSCISPNTIFLFLANELSRHCENEVKYEIAKYAAFYQLQMMAGSKPIVHLEAFLAKFMSIYKRHTNMLIALM